MTHYKGTPGDVQALGTYIKLMRASDSIEARMKRVLAREGLTLSQLGILEVLLHLGPMCQGALGTKLLKSSGNMTTVVDNLERRGLVRRERNVEDRRFVTVHLTEEGRALIEGYFPRHVGEIGEAMAALEPEEQTELARLCKKLGLANAS